MLKTLIRLKIFFTIKHHCYFYFHRSQIDVDYLVNEAGLLEKQKPTAYRYFKCKCGINYKTI